MSKILRLLLFEECNKNCAGCCNKDWDLANLSVETDFTQYTEILLTGGEPMLHPDIIMKAIIDIRNQIYSPIYLYTADASSPESIEQLLKNGLAGVTLTLHDPEDISDFIKFNDYVNQRRDFFTNRSLRLNVFKEVILSDVDLSLWKVVQDKVWIKNQHLPKDEVLKRYKIKEEE